MRATSGAGSASGTPHLPDPSRPLRHTRLVENVHGFGSRDPEIYQPPGGTGEPLSLAVALSDRTPRYPRKTGSVVTRTS